MKKLFVLILLLSAQFAFANSAYASHAEVVSFPSGCDYFIAKGNRGYYLCKYIKGYYPCLGNVILEYIKGYYPCLGNVILGDIDSNGLKNIYYPLKEREGVIYVEDYSMSKSRSIELYKEHCN
jgi:hypothetical protein